jgi:oligopeptide/dipeptide ABC transporter ATP-binding protein
VSVPEGEHNLLDVQGLTVDFRIGRRRPPLRAVDDVTFTIAPEETVGLVGESGSGKTTIGRAVLGLTPITAGRIRFAGAEITTVGDRERRRLSRELQVVFQDPYSSLNPTRTIGQTLAEMLRSDAQAGRAETERRIRWWLERVGLPPDAAVRYPAQFSGGQRQRIAIARALMVRPRLVICDEAVSALDLSVQAQVLNLLADLQREFKLGYLFIAHDLAVVRHVSHRIVVLYRGRIVEEGDARAIYDSPAHPYTKSLLAAAPQPDPEVQRRRRAALPTASETAAPPPRAGCPFAPRCPHALDTCWTERPELERTPEGVDVACHRWRELREVEAVNAVTDAV